MLDTSDTFVPSAAHVYLTRVPFGTATFPCLDFCNDQQVSKGKGLMLKSSWSPLTAFGFDKCTIFCVAQCRTNASSKNSYMFGLNQEATSNRVSFYVNVDSTPQVNWQWASSGTTGGKAASINADCISTNWMLWEVSHNSSSGAYFFTNGVAMTNSTDCATNRWPVIAEFWVGNLSGINPMEGQIAELVVYTNFLSGTDLTTARTYFQTNYNLW